jgi:hypothetical protein
LLALLGLCYVCGTIFSVGTTYIFGAIHFSKILNITKISACLWRFCPGRTGEQLLEKLAVLRACLSIWMGKSEAGKRGVEVCNPWKNT